MTRRQSDRDEVVYKVGRDAITGRFVPVAEAERRPDTTVVVTMRRLRKEGDDDSSE